MMTVEKTVRRSELSDLLRDRKGELGMSLRALADACVDPENPEAGPQYKRTTLDGLMKNVVGVQPPTLPQLRALAEAFRLPLGLIQEAAGAQFFGIDTVWAQDGKVRAIVYQVQELDADDQDRVMALMQSWQKLKRD
ncbi:helix-turn-helix domain-containing protein [Streptomyces justiciae]|uniref:Helix-turn-helix domain-containing protein n=1 Tax=Streptomyces justiciae TaxID=2780140 RepID=A0ABU3M742_9ACTN|nr:helix-turn-helix domain-containing protein [Streptomyces justiciae]MDT7847255.1 helix-turn-helix domain-containing protein [Streptomyces justiciae]